MNHSFIKMLHYEYKANYMMWLYNLIICVGLITFIYFLDTSKGSFLQALAFPIFFLLTWVFTINSYQESTKKQSMQMYHLIPVSKNIKFLSKQLITLLAFPLIVMLIIAVSILLFLYFIDVPDFFSRLGNSFPESLKINILLTWIFGHSVATFFAIIFRKNKILYAILVYFGFQFITSIFMILIFSGGRNPNDVLSGSFDVQNIGQIVSVVLLILSVVLYAISYRLFFRRQL